MTKAQNKWYAFFINVLSGGRVRVSKSEGEAFVVATFSFKKQLSIFLKPLQIPHPWRRRVP